MHVLNILNMLKHLLVCDGSVSIFVCVYLWWPIGNGFITQCLQGLHGSIVSCCLAGAPLANELMTPYRQLHIEDLRNRIMVPGMNRNKRKKGIFIIKIFAITIKTICYYIICLYTNWRFMSDLKKTRQKVREGGAHTFWAKLSIHTFPN